MKVKGGLKLIVLKILNNKDVTGYDLIHEIELNTGFWKPSPGSIYPLMNDLLKRKLVSCKKKGNKKIYSISKEGKEFYKKIKIKKAKIVRDVFDGIKFLEFMADDKKELKVSLDLLKEFEKEDSLLEENTDSIIKLKISFMKALKKKGNAEKVNKILENTSKQLSKLG